MNVDATLAALAAAPLPPALRFPSFLRLARQVPALRPALDAGLDRPVDRALAGLAPPPAAAPPGANLSGDALGEAILAEQARADGGGALEPALAERLEAAAAGHPVWWVPAARLAVLASPARERAARMDLSDFELPYVYPGDLHPRLVAVLAVGDRVLASLHVDWMRKLTEWAADALSADLRQRGLWFWPHLRAMDEKKLAIALDALPPLRRAGPGARGLALAYRARIGLPVAAAAAALDPLEQAVLAVAIASDRPR